MELSLTVLLTGFAVVFAVLLVLIGVIKLYGTIIYRLQTKKSRKIVKEEIVADEDHSPASVVPEPAPSASGEEDDDALIAVIAAAVYSVYSPAKVRIRSIRRETSGRSAWREAGLRDNTRSF